jgi:hypothetical protein
MGATDVIISLLGRAAKVGPAMEELVDACAAEKPHRDWARVRALDWQADVERVATWFGALLEASPPRAVGAADLYFGLNNLGLPDGGITAGLYVIGHAPAPKWPGRIVWEPPGYVDDAPLLGTLYSIGYDREGGLENDLEYPIHLGYAALLVRELGRRFVVPLIGTELRAGFDSGDILKIGTVGEDGLRLDVGWG